MSEQMLLQLLQPFTYAVIAAGFASIWFYARHIHAAGWWAACYAFGSVAFLISYLTAGGIGPWASWTSNILFFLTTSLYVTGHFIRLRKPVPVKQLAALGVLILVSLVLLRHVYPDVAMRTIAMNLLNAAGFSLAIKPLLTTSEYRPTVPLIERIAGIILAFFVTTFIVRCVLLGTGVIDVGMTESSYSESWMAISFRITVTFTAIASAVILYVMLGMDLMADMQRRSQVDPMTGLLNKLSFETQAAQAIAACQGRGRPVSLVLCDIDFFKKVNDTHGHAAGDVVISWFGRMMGNTVRSADLAGRVGGEEFAMLLAGCPQNNAVAIAEALRGVIAENPIMTGDATLPVTASFGVVEANPTETFEMLFQRADEMLYAAKRAGRDRVRFPLPNLDAPTAMTPVTPAKAAAKTFRDAISANLVN